MVDVLSRVLSATWPLPNGSEIWLFPLIALGALGALVAALWVLVAMSGGLFWIGGRVVAPVWRWTGIKIQIEASDQTMYRLVTVSVPILSIYALFNEKLWSWWWLFWWALWAAMQVQKLYEVCRPHRDSWKRVELDPAARSALERAAERSLKEILTR
jgi:hypothetical protein